MSKTVTIAFDHHGRIAAGVMGEKERTVPPHEPIEVPSVYGQYLLENRIAYDPSVREKEAMAEAEAQAKRALLAEQEAVTLERVTKLSDTVADLEDELDKERKRVKEVQDAADKQKADDAKTIADLTSKVAGLEAEIGTLQQPEKPAEKPKGGQAKAD